MDLGQFDRTARASNRAVVKEATEAMRAVALTLYSDLQAPVLDAGTHGSPVASGRLAASMRLEINGIDETHEPADPSYVYPPGSGPRTLPPRTIRNRAISRVSAKLRTFKLGDSIYISNSVPYIRKIELGGHSWQTPDGVFSRTVRVTVRRFANLNLRVRYV